MRRSRTASLDCGEDLRCMRYPVKKETSAGSAYSNRWLVQTGVGDNLGILIKGGQLLEMASTSTTLVIDKTGTLNSGKMKIQSP